MVCWIGRLIFVTFIIGEFIQARAELLPGCETQKQLATSQAGTLRGPRPGFDFSMSSSNHPIVVHATAATSEDYAQRILSYADKSWDVIVDQMKFRAPRPDHADDADPRIDIYIRGDLTPGVGGYTGFSGFYEETPEADAYGYLVIADQLKDTYIRGVVAHEFFHLVQMSYDWFEHPGFMEATAVWVTDHVFDDENFYQNYYAYYNKSPFQSLDKISLADPYQYGAGLWFQFLDERFGQGNGGIVKTIWEFSSQETMDTEPDYFDAMTTLLGGDQSLKSAFHEFGRWRLSVGSRAGDEHLREAAAWPDRVIPFFIEGGAIEFNQVVPWSVLSGMQPFSHSYLRFTLPAVDKDKPIDFDFKLDPVCEGYVRAEVLRSTAEVIVILTRTFDEVYDPETSTEDSLPVSGTIRLRAAQ